MHLVGISNMNTMAILISFVCWCGLIWVIAGAIKSRRKNKTTKGWLKINGTISSNEVSRIIEEKEFQEQAIRYIYRIDGQQYTCGLTFRILDTSPINKRLNKLKPGKQVTVLYNPNHKEESLLKKFYRQQSLWELITLMIVLLVPAVLGMLIGIGFV